jgi:hypothetical protein
MPIPANAPIEGYPHPGTGDRHVLVLDKDNCWLYELYGSHVQTSGNWSASSAAVWDLLGNEQRPYTWTSADAAGLSVFAGLARYDEVAAGQIKHALRFSLSQSRAAFVPPASHWASSSTDTTLAPMGMRLRLKSSYDISKFSATTISAGQSVTLNWATTGTSYAIVTPDIGAIRGSSAVVAPAATTTYTLDATNAYGRTKKTLKITVQ